MTTTIQRIAALDGIRTIAMAGVFAAHITPRFMGGVGLDIFFVLSGFVITRLLYNERASIGKINLLRFYRQRLVRLWPALLVVAAASIAMAQLAGLGSLRHTTLDALVAATYNMDFLRAFASDNIVPGHFHYGGWHLLGRSYAADYSNPGFLLAHTWSLSLEEHFYLVWPLLLMALLRLRRPALIQISLAALVVAVAIWRIHLWNEGGSALRVTASLDTRADLILAGCLLALTLQFSSPLIVERIGAMARTLAWPSLAFMAVVVLMPDPKSNGAYFGDVNRYVQIGTSAVGLATLVLIACFATSPKYSATRLLSHKWLAWPGRHLSYGFYLWHFPIIVLFLYRLPEVRFWPFALLLSSIAALGSYYLVEKPFRQWANRPKNCVNGHALTKETRLVGSIPCACGGHRIDHCAICGTSLLTPKAQLHDECAAIASYIYNFAEASKFKKKEPPFQAN